MINVRELKPAQAKAAYTLDRHVSVTAGPGAGKTTVLVERYLQILRTSDTSVDQIVAITFTNRAANEMRERLREELDRLLRDAPPNQRRTWMRHKRTLDGAVITTIHGFCARLLREFPVEADIDPQFTLLDQHQSAMLEESVAEEALTSFIDTGHEAITRLTAGVGRLKLAEGLIRIFRAMRNQGLTLEQVSGRTIESHATLNDYNAALEELDALMSDFLANRELPKGAEGRRRETARRWPHFREVLREMPRQMLAGKLTWSSLAEYCQAIEEFREKTRPGAVGVIGALVKELDKLIWEKKLGGRVPRVWFDLYAVQYATELIAILAGIEQRMQEEKQRQLALDFDDLQSRALKLLDDHPEALRRASHRYRFFLVDEFQDTNALQRDLMARLALGPGERVNLFIVGDRKQSIYGFRGADVDVFREMTKTLEAQGGESKPLNLNFRSQPPLIDFFNLLFERIFTPGEDPNAERLNELGFVEHEESEAHREGEDKPPLVELLIDLRPDTPKQDVTEAPARTEETPRERDAWQLARRIGSLVGSERSDGGDRHRFKFRDIALLFRAMPEAWVYESALRRAGIPYLTIQGKGFYEREEITDLIQLLRFLDNKTDDLALAAVLRSPLCGVSDNALLALRCSPAAQGMERGALRRRGGVRDLFHALGHPEEIENTRPGDFPALWAARQWLDEIVERRNHCGLAELLRFAVESSEFRSVIAATFDGAQRLANVEKLFILAERFERSGAHMIRDFVRFLQDFEAARGRESEGQIDNSADAVRLMTIHQSKGLEFPVVILPELHRQADVRTEWYMLDRQLGLTLKIPDGRGWLVAGKTMIRLRERAKLRDQFESMRLLYVAMTRAQDLLILSGAAKDLKSGRGSWLGWIANALGLDESVHTGVANIDQRVPVRVVLNLRDDHLEPEPLELKTTPAPAEISDLPKPRAEAFPLLRPLAPERHNALHRFSVTQLINYRRCPRQYFFDRVLHAPSGEEIAVWNDAEAPEPPANLNATLKGAVIHRFCEKYSEGDPLECLRSSLTDVLRLREAELGDRVMELDLERAVKDLEPLAASYLSSGVRERVESARIGAEGREGLGVLSELRFRLRRPLGILTGTIDKLLIGSGPDGLSVEIIDFKTNRFRSKKVGKGEQFTPANQGQLSFMFPAPTADGDMFIQAEADAAAADYELQMQSYALAARELMPEARRIQVTLHFLDPDVETHLPARLLGRDACATAIDRAMLAVISSNLPKDFEVRPADHCRVCKFQEMCQAGRRWLADQKRI
jgi:ATP-dependent helicase/nuclease subunit A